MPEASLKELVDSVPELRLRLFITDCGLALPIPEGASIESRLRDLGVPVSTIAALSPPPSPTAGGRWTSPFDRREMIFVPAGRFQMGSPSGEPDREPDETQHSQTIDRGLWVDTTEVSNEAFQRFVIALPEWQKGRMPPALHDGNYLKEWQGTDYPAGEGESPVTFVTWPAARAYAAWAGKRLPTEAEWEYVARAGTTTAYWWGDKFDPSRVRATRGDKSPETAKARTSPWGVQDIIGGVWEWTASVYRPYPYGVMDGREDLRASGPRVIRGGAWANGGRFLRVANRNYEEPARTIDLVGFRCVK